MNFGKGYVFLNNFPIKVLLYIRQLKFFTLFAVRSKSVNLILIVLFWKSGGIIDLYLDSLKLDQKLLNIWT